MSTFDYGAFADAYSQFVPTRASYATCAKKPEMKYISNPKDSKFAVPKDFKEQMQEYMKSPTQI